jgi:hypothetical protein
MTMVNLLGIFEPSEFWQEPDWRERDCASRMGRLYFHRGGINDKSNKCSGATSRRAQQGPDTGTESGSGNIGDRVFEWIGSFTQDRWEDNFRRRETENVFSTEGQAGQRARKQRYGGAEAAVHCGAQEDRFGTTSQMGKIQSTAESRVVRNSASPDSRSAAGEPEVTPAACGSIDSSRALRSLRETHS